MSTNNPIDPGNTPLLTPSPSAWLDAVFADFDTFLIDHAAAEKKASGMAISMISHYPDRLHLVEAMAELAVEELNHYREVIKILHQRGLQLGADTKDEYVIDLRKAIRGGKDHYLLDRLLIGGIIEARGAERFGLIAKRFKPGALKTLYTTITESEQRHFKLMIELAQRYFDYQSVAQRVAQLLEIEAELCQAMPIRAALH